MQETTFWDKYSIQVISTASGVLIALVAAFLTYYLSKHQTNNDNKHKYQGLLYTLHVELDWHYHHFDLMTNTLRKLEKNSMAIERFATNGDPMLFDLSIVENIVLKLTDYKNFDHAIVALLTSYLNNLKDINSYLDFRIANELLDNQVGNHDSKQIISDYFQTLRSEYVDKTQPVINDIQKLIKDELKNYPKEVFISESKGK